MTKGTKIADSADLARANDWSRQAYGALRDWDVARRGRWSTWDSGAVLLTVDTMANGAACEPVTIAAASNRLVFYTRDWETDLPLPGQSFGEAIAALKDLARKWFTGEIALAAFYLGDVWQGALAINPAQLEEEMQLAVNWIATQTAVDRVELHTPRRETDQKFGLAVNGKPIGVPRTQ